MTQETLLIHLKNIKTDLSLEYLNVFDTWNRMSVIFIYYPALGMYGDEAKELALDILSSLYQYLKDRDYCYIPDSGFLAMYHPEVVRKLIDWFKTFTNENKLSNDELMQLLSQKIEEYSFEVDAEEKYSVSKYYHYNKTNLKTLPKYFLIGASLGFIGKYIYHKYAAKK